MQLNGSQISSMNIQLLSSSRHDYFVFFVNVSYNGLVYCYFKIVHPLDECGM